jgi:hypothetical protein
MAKQKLPIQWILAFALSPVVILALIVIIRSSGGGETASRKQHEDVTKAIRLNRGLRPKYDAAMRDKNLTVNEANAILKEANAINAKGKQ